MHPIESFDWTGSVFRRTLKHMMYTESIEVDTDISVLRRVSSIVSSELSLQEMLGEILGLTAQVTGCDACLVYLV